MVLLLAVALLCPARKARADVAPAPLVIGAAVAVVTFTIINVVYTLEATVMATDNERPSKAFSTAETIVTAPQTALWSLAPILVDNPDDPSEEALWLLYPMWVTSLTTHGIWGLASDTVHPQTLGAVSPAIGADLTLTLNAVSKGASGRLLTLPSAILQMVITAPQVAVGTAHLVRTSEDDVAWTLLTAWSGALFLHGTASLIWGPRPRPEPGYSWKRPAPPPTTLSLGVFRDWRGGSVPAVMARGVF